MGGYFRNAAGEEQYVHDDEIKDAVASGWKPREDITFDSPTGSTRTLTPEQVGQAYDQRVAPAYTTTDQSTLRSLNEQQTLQNIYGGLGQQLITGAEGAAGAVTFGATDWALEGVGADTDKRAKANPNARLAGEVGGSLAAAFLPGGQTKLGMMLAKTPAGFASLQAGNLGKRLGGGLAARAAAEAAEGAAYGIGQGISTLALTNVPLSAEAVFSELAKGGLYGAGFGAVGGAAGHGLGKMADKLKLGREAAEAAAKEADAASSPGATFGLDEAETAVFRDKFKTGFTEAEEAAQHVAAAYTAPITPKDIIYSARMSRDLALDAQSLVNPKLIASEIKTIQKAQGDLGRLFGGFNDGLDRPDILDAGGLKMLQDSPEKWVAAAKPLDEWREAAVSISKKAGLDGQTSAAKFISETPEQLQKRLANVGETVDGLDGAMDDATYALVQRAMDGVLEEDNVKLLAKKLNKLEDLLEKTTAEMPSPYVRSVSPGKIEMQGPEATAKLLESDPHQRVAAVARGKIDPTRAAGVDAEAGLLSVAGAKMNTSWGISKPRALTDADLNRFLKMKPEEAIAAAADYSAYLKQLDAFVTKFDDGNAGAKLAGGLEKVSAATAMLRKGGDITEGSSGITIIAGMVGMSEIPEMDGPADELLKLWIGSKVLKGGKSLVPKGAGKNALLGFLKDAARGTGARMGAQAASKATGATGIGSAFARGIGSTAGVKLASALVDRISGQAGRVAQATGGHISRISRTTENLAKAGSKATRAIAPTATAILSSVSFGDDPPKAASLQESYKARMNELAAISANPMGTHQRLFDNLADVRAVNAQLADKLEMQAMAIATAALKEAPKDPGTMMRLGESRWRPSEAQLCKWASYLRGATDPAGVYERAMAGRCTPNEAKALRELHPATFAEIQQSVAENIQEIRATSTRAQRTNLSILFGVPVESLSAKHSLDWVQQQFAERAGPDSEPVDLNAEAFKPNEPTEAQKL